MIATLTRNWRSIEDARVTQRDVGLSLLALWLQTATILALS